jgi:hypothetical protein
MAKRKGEEDEDEFGGALETREWEEEQVRLDRDWYMTGEEGGVVSSLSPTVVSSLIANLRLETKNIIHLRNTKTWMLPNRPRLLLSKWYVIVICDRNLFTNRNVQKKISARQAQYVCDMLRTSVEIANSLVECRQ